jgi:hypothetical protein
MDFRNKREHSRLDRVYGRRILKWLRDGLPPTDDFQLEEDEISLSREIERIATSMGAISDSGLSFRIESPDAKHSVIVVESPGNGRTIRIRPVSSITRPRKDPIVSMDNTFHNEISLSDTQIPDSGWIRFSDLEVGYVSLEKLLRQTIGDSPVWS